MMSTTFWIQLLGIIFGLAMLYFTFVKYKRKELNRNEFWFWLLSWIVLMGIALKPSLLDFLIAPLNFYRRLDFFVVMGFFLLLALGFYNYSISKNLQRRFEILVRRDAIRRVDERDLTPDRTIKPPLQEVK